MRVERIARDKVRIFVSYDDLEQRGIDREEIWHHGKKVQELFWDMMETAYVEVGFEIAGPIAVEAFTMPTEGVVVIVTRIPSIPGSGLNDEEEMTEEDFLSTEEGALVFRFSDLEDVIGVAHSLVDHGLESTLYRYEGQYHLSVDDPLVLDMYQRVWSILQEYGDASPATEAVLQEYGTKVIEHNAIAIVAEKFSL
jgi:adapter protein MecA 1/2